MSLEAYYHKLIYYTDKKLSEPLYCQKSLSITDTIDPVTGTVDYGKKQIYKTIC